MEKALSGFSRKAHLFLPPGNLTDKNGVGGQAEGMGIGSRERRERKDSKMLQEQLS